VNLVTGASGFVGSWVMETAPSNTIGCRREIPQGDFDTIVHCAIANDLDTDTLLLKQVAALRPNRLIYISSGAARDPESSEYAANKLACEDIALEAGAVVARLYSFIGPRLTRFAPYEMMRQAIEQKCVMVRSRSVRSYLYAEDMGKRIWTLNEPGIHEVGSSVPVNMATLGANIAAAYNVPLICNYTEEATEYLPVEGQEPRSLTEQIRLTAEWLKQGG